MKYIITYVNYLDYEGSSEPVNYILTEKQWSLKKEQLIKQGYKERIDSKGLTSFSLEDGSYNHVFFVGLVESAKKLFKVPKRKYSKPKTKYPEGHPFHDQTFDYF